MTRFQFRAWDKGKHKMYRFDLFDLDEDFLLSTNPPGPCIENMPIMQSIGLEDKHGVVIFEGDLLKGNGSHVFTVEWGKYGWHIRFKDLGSEYSEPFDDNLMEEYEPLVIGNIHENPELLD